LKFKSIASYILVIGQSPKRKNFNSEGADGIILPNLSWRNISHIGLRAKKDSLPVFC
jgi:hypothetical protein